MLEKKSHLYAKKTMRCDSMRQKEEEKEEKKLKEEEIELRY